MDYEAEVVSADTGTPVVTPEVVEPQTKVEETTPEVKAEEVVEPTKEPEKVEENLVELPDGRKLPPKEAETEYRKLYSDYTRKSQELAKYKTSDPEISTPTKEEKGWEPQSWEEVVERSKQALREDLEREQQATAESIKKSEDLVLSQLEEIRKENPNLNQNQLFDHAMKWKFTDLKLAHANFKETQASIKKATEATVQNLQKRQADPISGGPQGGAISDDDVYDPGARNMSMVDYLRSLK